MAIYEVYEADDSIIPIMELAKPLPIRIEITDDVVKLHIGQRDMDWSRKTGVLQGSGTSFDSSVNPAIQDGTPPTQEGTE